MNSKHSRGANCGRRLSHFSINLYTSTMRLNLALVITNALRDSSRGTPQNETDSLWGAGTGKTRRALKGWKPNQFHFAESRSEEHTSELQSQSNLVCRLL